MHFNAIVLQVAQAFRQSWNFHHASGVLVRKHTAIKAPNNSSTLFHNYDGSPYPIIPAPYSITTMHPPPPPVIPAPYSITTIPPPPPNNSGTLFHNYDGVFLHNPRGLVLAVTAPLPTTESKTLPLSRTHSKVGPLPDVDHDSPHFLVEMMRFPRGHG